MKKTFITEADAKKMFPEGFELECVEDAYEKGIEEGYLTLEQFMKRLNKLVEKI